MHTKVRIRDSSTGIAKGYRLDYMGSNSGRGKFFLNSTASRPAPRPSQPPIQWLPGAISPEVKRPGSEVDHSPPSSVEVKNGGAIPQLPRTSSWCSASLIKHKDIFTFINIKVNFFGNNFEGCYN
jgi:hypothetical protein